jgi:hypothetical protein
MRRVVAEEAHAQRVREILDQEPIANPDTYFAAAVALRKKRDFRQEIEVVQRFLSRPYGGKTKKIERLIARAERARDLLEQKRGR